MMGPYFIYLFVFPKLCVQNLNLILICFEHFASDLLPFPSENRCCVYVLSGNKQNKVFMDEIINLIQKYE